MNKPVHLRRQMASEYLRHQHGISMAPATLAKLASIGGGPRFRRFNRIPLYCPADLDEWVAERLTDRLRSTSDTASASVSGPHHARQLAEHLS